MKSTVSRLPERSVSTRLDFLRSKAAGCVWAAQFARREDTRELFVGIARQYRAIADQLEFMAKL